MLDSVLAHVVAGSPQKENIATEALAFVLNRWAAARAAVSALVSSVAGVPLDVTRVRTQVAVGEESRPDVVLYGRNGQVQGYIEAKFWAALTDAQPVRYIERLSGSGGAVLVFVAPERRLASLRTEIVERLKREGINPDLGVPNRIGVSGVSLELLSWARVLEVMRRAVTDPDATSDIHQLASLCMRFETDGFVPVSSEDLDDLRVPRLIMQFTGLATAIVDRALTEQLLSIKGLRPTHFAGASGRYARFDVAGFWIGSSCRAWARLGRSPIWVAFTNGPWGRAEMVREALRSWASSDPPRAYLDEDDGAVRVPIMIQPGVDRDNVVAHAIAQLKELRECLHGSGMPPLSDSQAQSTAAEEGSDARQSESQSEH